jgi:hypothetical protein
VGPYSDDFDLLEVWNGYDLARPDTMLAVFTEWLAMLGRGRRVTATGNSDSHKIRHVWAGYPRTYVRTPGGTSEPAAVLAALRQGRAFVTSGPFLEASVGDAGPGDVTVVREGVATVRVVARAPAWMALTQLEIWHDGAVVRSAAIPAQEPAAGARENARTSAERPRRGARQADPRTHSDADLRFETTLDVPITHDGYIVVLVRGEQTMDIAFGRAGIPPIAFTNPIWLDAGGDGLAPDPGDPQPSPGTFAAVEAQRVVDAGAEDIDASGAGSADDDAGTEAGETSRAGDVQFDDAGLGAE